MEFTSRKLLFKAWNRETRLMMRLNSIDCVRGELYRKDHILLQFTGLCDQHCEEIYEMDILVIGNEKFVVVWDAIENRWSVTKLQAQNKSVPLMKQTADAAIRICSYFESEQSLQIS